MGNGKYTVTIYQQVTSNKYKTLFSTFHNVKYNNENIVFLQSNKYAAYTHNSLAVIKANELSANLIEEKQKADMIINYITKTFLYDHFKAITMPTTGTYVPDLEQIMKTRKGICFDLAALVCCMMRSQGIPTQMIIGDTDRGYHAWNKIYINNRWLLVDVTNKIAAMDIRRYSPKLYY